MRRSQITLEKYVPAHLPTHASASSLPDSLPLRHSSPKTAPCPSASPSCPCSYASFRRCESLSESVRFAPQAALATAITDPNTPWLRRSLQATRSFVGPARSLPPRVPILRRRFRSV